MNFKTAILIPVYVYTEEEMEQKKIGIDNESFGFKETEERAFWTIDAAFPERDKKDRTVFYSGGHDYVAPCKFKDFVSLINNHKKEN